MHTHTHPHIHTYTEIHACKDACAHALFCVHSQEQVAANEKRRRRNAAASASTSASTPTAEVPTLRLCPSCLFARLCVFVCVYICTHIYMYMYIYTAYIHIYIYIYPHIYAYLCVSNRKCHRGQSQQSWQSWFSPWRCRQLSATSTAPAATSQPPSVRLTTRPNSSRRRVRKYVQAHCGTRGHTARLAQSRACACRASYLYPIYIGFVHT